MKLLDYINNKELYRETSCIGGKWVDNSTRFDVLNPADGKAIGQVAEISDDQLGEAIAAAKSGFETWKQQSATERAGVLRKWYNLIIENQEDLARMITLEGGKPIKESRGEVAYGASFVEWYAEEARRIYGDIIPGHLSDKRIMVLRQPIGVVAAITPWNFPVAMITRKIAPALAAGCSVIVKPAEETPYSALALAELAKKAGFPDGVLNVVCGNDPARISKAFMDSPDVRKLSFTGSTQVGKLLYSQSADTLKKLSLELGGNAPFIVMDDADIEAAVEGAMSSKYRNSGQTCVCANRIFVQENVYDEFVKKLTHEVRNLKVGSGTDESTQVGPLINSNGLEKVERLMNDAVKKGATVLTGGKRHDFGNNYFEPTVICDITGEMDISREEIFGPIAPVVKFKTDEEVIALSNDTRAGLAAYFYGNTLSRIWRLAEALEYGMVGINTGLISTAVAPFGGVKESGFGREGSKYGIDEFVVMKYICMEV